MRKKIFFFLFLSGYIFAFNPYRKDNNNFLAEQIALYLNSHVRKIDNITSLKNAYSKGNDVIINLKIDSKNKDIQYLVKNHGLNYFKENLKLDLTQNICNNTLLRKVLSKNVIFQIHYFLSNNLNKEIFHIIINKKSCQRS